MALSKTYSFKGVSVANSYVKIASARIYKRAEDSQWFNHLELEVSASQGSEVIDRAGYIMPWSLATANPIAEGYNYLKTLPEFAGAVDC